MPTLNFLDPVCKTAVISVVSRNLTQQWYQDVQLTLLQQYVTFQPDQLKSEQENEVKRFCFVLTLWPQDKVKVNEVV